VGSDDGGADGVIVTISRQAASRGEQVAQQVAQQLGLPLVDPEAVHRAAARIELQKESLGDPQRADRIGERLAHLAVVLAGEPPEDTGWVLAPVPSSMEDPGYRRAVESMLRALGEAGNVVIAGFPAQVLLARAPRAVHALVVAPLPLRVQRMVLREDLPFRTAERVLRDADRDRAEFYRRFYNVAWDEPTLYDAVLNTARLGLEQAARVILSATRSRGA
jgi:cytidylate kinase